MTLVSLVSLVISGWFSIHFPVDCLLLSVMLLPVAAKAPINRGAGLKLIPGSDDAWKGVLWWPLMFSSAVVLS